MQRVVLIIHLILNHFFSNDRGSKRIKGGEQGIPTASWLVAESVTRVLIRSVYNKKTRLRIPVSFPTMEIMRSTVIKCPMEWSWTSIKKYINKRHLGTSVFFLARRENLSKI